MIYMKALEKIKKKYTGKWIALSGGRVVAVSTDYHELHKGLKEKVVDNSVEVIYSPSPKDKKYETML